MKNVTEKNERKVEYADEKGAMLVLDCIAHDKDGVAFTVFHYWNGQHVPQIMPAAEFFTQCKHKDL